MPASVPFTLDRDVFVALAAVAWADGVVAPEEASALRRAAAVCGVTGDDLAKVQACTESRVDLSDLGELELSADARVFVYALAVWMAQSDGVVVDSERATLLELGKLLRLSEQDKALATATRLDPAATAADLKRLATVIEAEASRQDSADGSRLPPGSSGWPVVGETLAFVRDAFGFVHERVHEHGTVFRTRLLGRDVAVITGPKACELWLDEAQIVREDAAFDHVLELIGGATLPSLDGATHRTRKRQVMAAFDRAALEHYLPRLEVTIGEALDLWADSGELEWANALRGLVIASIADSMLGLRDPVSVKGLVADYATVIDGFVAIPFALPGSALQRATEARDRLLAFMRECVAESRKTPQDDGLSRILCATHPDDGTIADEDAALEMHHIFMAGSILFAEVVGLVLQLGNDDAVRAAVAAEVHEHAPEGPVTLATCANMTLLQRVVREVKRITPVIPILFARAKRPIPFAGVSIPEGWRVCLALHHSHMLDDTYAEPERFDPDRFTEQRAEHRTHAHAYAPHGPGGASGHQCAGTDYTTYFMMLFAVLALRDYTWELPAQDLRYDGARLPPVPRDGLRVRLTRKRLAPAPQ